MHTIHHAAATGDLSVLKQLLETGTPVDLHDPETGHTPLMTACLSSRAGADTLDLLLAAGADLHAPAQPAPSDPVDTSILLDDPDPEIRALLEQIKNVPDSPPDDRPLIALAVAEASIDKIRFLLDHGADFRFRSREGYTLLTLAACARRIDVVDLLLAAGAPLDGVSSYGESALSVFSREGLFDQVRRLLDHGADPAPLQWSPLMQAVVFGSPDEVQQLIDEGADLEAVDFWSRTAFLLAVFSGRIDLATLLLERGADRSATGRCQSPPLSYPTERDDASMMRWLIDQGFDVDQADEFGTTPLMDAVSNGAIACMRILLDAGADPDRTDHVDEALMPKASDPRVIKLLLDRGGDPSDLETEVLRDFIGLGNAPDLPVTREDYLDGRFPRFGTANPERMQIPFWDAMVRCGWNAYQGAKQFDDSSYGRENPVWCHDRFGMSLTRLPDGRFIQIAGEHEDHYDPDFCIYNDVVIHDGGGGFEILGYPEDVFPPTDFHSATLVDDWIYIIGNLGHRSTANAHKHETPVYRLHITSGLIERVTVTGRSPGWIHSHRAEHIDGRIIISGGKMVRQLADSETEIIDHPARYALDLQISAWHRLD